jgi:streptogramin lyase
MLQLTGSGHNSQPASTGWRARLAAIVVASINIVVIALSYSQPSTTSARAVNSGPILYFNDTTAVRRYNGNTGAFVDTFIPSGAGGPNQMIGMVIGPDGNLYVSDGTQVQRYDGSTGAFIDIFISAAGGGLQAAYLLAFGPDGNIYLAGQDATDAFKSKVVRYSGASGAVIDTFIPALDRSQVAVNSLIFGADNNLYISAIALLGTDGYVLKYDGATGALISRFIAPGTTPLGAFPTGLAFGPRCSLYITSGPNVLRYDARTGIFLQTFASPGTDGHGTGGTQDIAFGPDGNLYVSMQFDNRVLRYNGVTGAFIDIFIPASPPHAANNFIFQIPPTTILSPATRIYLPIASSC